MPVFSQTLRRDHSGKRSCQINSLHLVFFRISQKHGLLWAVYGVLSGLCATAYATPIPDARGPVIALHGPATAHPASMLDSPAALTLLTKDHLYFSTAMVINHRSVQRRTLASSANTITSGNQETPREFSKDSFDDARPQFALIATSKLGSDSLSAGLALTGEWSSASLLNRSASGEIFEGAAQGQNRYHGTDQTFAQLNASLGVSLRIVDGLFAGAGVNYIFGLADIGFVRDTGLDPPCVETKCSIERDQAAESIRANGSVDAISYSLGILTTLWPRITIGFGYTSAPIGLGGSGLAATGPARVRRAEQYAGVDLPDIAGITLSGRATILYRLPHRFMLGATWQITDSLFLNAQVRWQLFRQITRLEIRLSGADFRDPPAVPTRIVFYRGLRDVLAAQLGARFMLSPKFEIQGGVMWTSGAVRPDATSAFLIDNGAVDTLFAIRWTPKRQWTFEAGYSLVLMPSIVSDTSVYDPDFSFSCTESNFDIETEPCVQKAAGRGIASSAGTYTRITQRIGLSAGFQW